MLFFLQERVEKLRTLANPDAGVILVHHTKKIQKKSLEEDPFQSFSGAGSLRSFYTTGIIMFRPDEQQSNRQLICELRNGHAIPPKCIDKIDNCWHTIDHESRRLVNKDYGQKLDAERSRRHDVILQLIYEEAREKGKEAIDLFIDLLKQNVPSGISNTFLEELRQEKEEINKSKEKFINLSRISDVMKRVCKKIPGVGKLISEIKEKKL